MTPERWSEEEFLARLQEVGAQGYHHLHPFHIRMNAGDLDRDSIRLWVANRFYYQRNIPRKDAAILANCPVREVRQKWIKRIIDHDGAAGQVGGIEKWIRLGIACDLAAEEMMDERHVRPGVRFAVDAYVNFAADAAMADRDRLLANGVVRPGFDDKAARRLSKTLRLDRV